MNELQGGQILSRVEQKTQLFHYKTKYVPIVSCMMYLNYYFTIATH